MNSIQEAIADLLGGGGLTAGKFFLALLIFSVLWGLVVGIAWFYQSNNLQGQGRTPESKVVKRTKTIVYSGSWVVGLFFLLYVLGLAITS